MTAQIDQANTDQATSLANGLRALADFITANSQLAEPLAPYIGFHYVAAWGTPDQKTLVAELVKAGARFPGATVDKHYFDNYFNVDIRFGDEVTLHVSGDRDAVCERVVVGTDTVTKRVKDPELLAQVPEIDVTETVDRVEWRCWPLLAETTGNAA